MNPSDPLILKIADADPARRDTPSGSEHSEMAYRVRQRVLQNISAAEEVRATRNFATEQKPDKRRRALRTLGGIALLAGSSALVVLVGGVIGLLGHHQTNTHHSATVGPPSTRIAMGRVECFPAVKAKSSLCGREFTTALPAGWHRFTGTSPGSRPAHRLYALARDEGGCHLQITPNVAIGTQYANRSYHGRETGRPPFTYVGSVDRPLASDRVLEIGAEAWVGPPTPGSTQCSAIKARSYYPLLTRTDRLIISSLQVS